MRSKGVERVASVMSLPSCCRSMRRCWADRKKSEEIRICECTQYLEVAQMFAGRVKDVCSVSQADARGNATVGDSAQGETEWLLISGQSSRLVSHTVADVENSNGWNNKSLVDERKQERVAIAERCYEPTLDRESRSTPVAGCPLLGGLGESW